MSVRIPLKSYLPEMTVLSFLIWFAIGALALRDHPKEAEYYLYGLPCLAGVLAISASKSRSRIVEFVFNAVAVFALLVSMICYIRDTQGYRPEVDAFLLRLALAFGMTSILVYLAALRARWRDWVFIGGLVLLWAGAFAVMIFR